MIDVHHHFNPPGLPGGGRPGWSPQKALDDMEAAGITAAIGYPGPVPYQLHGADCTSHARRLNDFGAETAMCKPGRLGLFAALPMADVEATLRELEHIDRNIPHDGYGIATNYGEKWLGDPHFTPIWEELNRRKACVFVHPTDAPCCTPAQLGYSHSQFTGPWIEWPMNTARTLFSLITSGTLRRFSDIRFIFCHGGGLFGQLVGRLEGFGGWHPVGEQRLQEIFPHGLRQELHHLHFECAQAMSPENFALVRSLVPDTQLLFGTDYDRFPLSHAVTQFNALQLPEDTRRRIARGNAEGLFSRFTGNTT